MEISRQEVDSLKARILPVRKPRQLFVLCWSYGSQVLIARSNDYFLDFAPVIRHTSKHDAEFVEIEFH